MVNMEDLGWNKEKCEEMFDKLDREIARREKVIGRQLYIYEVFDTICDVTDNKKEAVVLSAFFTFADVIEQKGVRIHDSSRSRTKN